MAELNIGKHCAKSDCMQLDFLPFTCDGCGNVFCKEHNVKDQHNCTLELLVRDEQKAGPYTTYACALIGCSKTEMVKVQCPQCQNNYCMQHRHASDHNCRELEIKPKSMEKTAQHIQSILDKKATGGGKAPKGVPKSQKAQETAAKVALMKMKMKAKGDQGVPQSSRVYLAINLPSSGDDSASLLNTKQVQIFLDQEFTVGKAVDTIAAVGDIKNENNKADAPKLMLRTLSAGLVYHMEDKLVDLIRNKQLYNGSTVELYYTEEY